MSIIKVNKIENTATTNGGMEIDNTGHVQIDGVQMPSAGALSNRNLIINGAMEVAQRGTSFTFNSSTGSVTYTLDRFACQLANADQAVLNINQAAVTGLPGFKDALICQMSTAETTINSDENLQIRYRMEGQEVAGLLHGSAQAQALILSFYVNTDVEGTYCVGVFKDDANRGFCGQYTISSGETGGWVRKTISIPGDTTGVINDDTGIGMQFHWFLAAGTDRTSGNSMLNTWAPFSTDSFASGQTANVMSANDNFWHITGIQLERGEVATPYEHKPLAVELARCQRYFQLCMGGWRGVIGGASHQASATVNFHTEMRATPSIEVLSWSTGLRFAQNTFVAVSEDKTGFIARATSSSAGGNDSWTGTFSATSEVS